MYVRLASFKIHLNRMPRIRIRIEIRTYIYNLYCSIVVMHHNVQNSCRVANNERLPMRSYTHINAVWNGLLLCGCINVCSSACFNSICNFYKFSDQFKLILGYMLCYIRATCHWEDCYHHHYGYYEANWIL